MEQTVQKALNLLEALVKSGQPRRLTELARQLELTKPNVYRLLSTLSALGYVKKDTATSMYSPTMKLWEMGSMLVRDADLVTVAAPRLRRLSADTHESVQLAVFDSGFCVYVDKVDSPQPLKAITSIGSRLPATVTSTGKALLAWAPVEALDQAMGHVKRFTPLTLTLILSWRGLPAPVATSDERRPRRESRGLWEIARRALSHQVRTSLPAWQDRCRLRRAHCHRDKDLCVRCRPPARRRFDRFPCERSSSR